MKNIDLAKIVVFTTIALLLTNCPHNRTTSRTEEAVIRIEEKMDRKIDSVANATEGLIIQSHLSDEKRTKVILRRELLNFLIKETDLDNRKTTLSDIQRDLELLEAELEKDTTLLRK